jgi:hypothetical protein
VKSSILFAAALSLSNMAPLAMADSLSLEISNPNQFGSPGGVETFQGTITNNTGLSLNSTDLFLNFSGYDPLQVTLDQLLGSSSFSIPNGATSNVVDLFTFGLASTAAVPATYPAQLVLEDFAGDLSLAQTVTVSTVPEPASVELIGTVVLLLLLLPFRKRLKPVIPILVLAIIGARLEAQVSAVQFVTANPGVIQTSSGGPVMVALPIKNNGSADAGNVQITSATLRSVSPTSPLSFPVGLGLIASGRTAVFQANFSGGGFALGTPYLLTVRGTYEVGGQTAGFTVNRFVEVTQRKGGAVTPSPLPTPPRTAGCYVNTRNGWQNVACATEAFINAHFPHPDVQLGITTPSSTPIVYGQVQTTVPEVTAEGNNSSGGCPPSAVTTPNQWSIQNNTNGWTIAGGPSQGHTGVTQFVTQSDGATTGVCIWNIDATSQDYSHVTCVSPTAQQRAGGLQAFDSANIAGIVNGDGTLSMVAEISWVPSGDPNQYAVVGVGDTYGLTGNWNQIGGGLLGIGNCSQAQFTNAEVVTQILASTCAGDTQAFSAVCAPPTLQPNANFFTSALETLETNNLTQVGTPSLTYLNSDLVITNITGTTTGNCLGPSHAYVKDSPEDFGGTPSNIGNQVWWESPDLFVVPTGTPVDINSVSTESAVTPGGVFDVWVRLHNDLGCSDVTGAKTLVYLADPSALSVQWESITGGVYVGNNMSSSGVTVPAGGEALIGPLTFTAPTTGIGNGHKCMLAAIQADGEPPPTNSTDAPDSNQVAQRNLQFIAPCAFPLTNGTTTDGNVQITLSVTPNTGTGPSLTTLPQVAVDFDDADSSWYNVWNSQTGNGTTFAVTHNSVSSKTTVTLGTFSVALNAVPLTANQTRNATGIIEPETGSLTLQIGATLTDSSGKVLVTNGGSCTATAVSIQ